MITSDKLFRRILVLLRWSIFFFIVSEFIKTPTVEAVKLLNIPNEIIIGIFFIFYLICTILTLLYEDILQNYTILLLDLTFSALLFLSYSTEINSYPNNTMALILCLPVLEASLINLRTSFIITLISAVSYAICQEMFKIALFKELPHYIQTSHFAFVIVFLFISYLASYLFDVLKRKEKISNALFKIIALRQLIAKKDTLGEMINIIFKTIRRLIPSQTTVIYLLEKDTKDKLILNVSQIISPSGQKFIAFDPQTASSVLSLAFKDKKVYKIDNFDKLAKDIIAKDENIKSILIAPLVDNGESIGLIALAHNKYRYFKDEDLEVLHILSTEAAGVIKNIYSVHISKITAQDSLSGMYTHAHFMDYLKDAVKKYKNLSVLFINIDYFAQVNTRFGHGAGDMLIKQVGALIKQHIRKSDFISRYSADQFAVAMPDVNKVESVVEAEKIRQAVEDYAFLIEGKPVKITVSCGLSLLTESAKTETSLIEKAREALKEAKEKGRNKIFINE